MKKVQCVHIYHGTQGNGGLYLDEIIKALEEQGISQEVYVSYYFPFNYGKKYFFKYTDLLGGMKKGLFRLFLRYFELIFGLCRTFISLLLRRPSIINYSVISNVYFPEKIFIIALKWFTNSKIVFTCHDVIPFSETQSNIEFLVRRKKSFIRKADYYIVHTLQSRDELIKYYGIISHKIFFYRFPIMDLERLPFIKKGNKNSKNLDFLFIGHLRKEKGLDFLLEAWKLYFVRYKPYGIKLFIAGNAPKGKTWDRINLAKYNIFLCDKYLTDQEYYDLVISANYVVLPYIRGTNSGVISTVLSLGANVLCSDIQMFKQNPLVSETEFFKSNDIHSFVESIHQLAINRNLKDKSKQLKLYRKEFRLELQEVYDCLLAI